MTVSEFKALDYEIRNGIHNLKRQNIKPEFLILNRDLFEDAKGTLESQHILVHACEQTDLTEGYTYRGIKIAVSESTIRICRVM